MSKVAVQLLSWNGEAHLRRVLASLAKQTDADFELLILDNGSTDSSIKIIDEALKTFPRQYRFIKSETNTGFAGGHNVLFAMSDAPFVCCVNQDVILSDDYLEHVVEFLDKTPAAGSASGVLRREDGSIDTAGLAKNWYEKVCDLKTAPVPPFVQVFGVSGALPVYRRAAVLAVSPDGNLFDKNFFAYKEDIDLAWRFNLGGWISYVVSAAQAIHERGFGANKKWDASYYFRQRLSSRNHLLTLVKNLRGAELWLLPVIIFYELGKAVYTAIFVPKALGYIAGFFALLPETLKIRKVCALRLKASNNRHG